MNPAGHVRRVASFFGVWVKSFYLVSEHDVHVSLIRNVVLHLLLFGWGASVSSMISRKRITNLSWESGLSAPPLHRVFHFAGGNVQIFALDCESFPLVEAHCAGILPVRFQGQRNSSLFHVVHELLADAM